jgi:hypothetical protein
MHRSSPCCEDATGGAQIELDVSRSTQQADRRPRSEPTMDNFSLNLELHAMVINGGDMPLFINPDDSKQF